MATVTATFPEILDSSKNCILVKRLGKHHVRRYPRNVKGGMSIFRATFKCAYADLIEFKPLFDLEERDELGD